jgi:hypothetical protein
MANPVLDSHRERHLRETRRFDPIAWAWAHSCSIRDGTNIIRVVSKGCAKRIMPARDIHATQSFSAYLEIHRQDRRGLTPIAELPEAVDPAHQEQGPHTTPCLRKIADPPCTRLITREVFSAWTLFT